MIGGVERILSLTFGAGGNETNYLGHGWSGDEPGGRWMIGQSSELWLEHPGFGCDLVLEIEVDVTEMPQGRAAQRLAVGVRDAGIANVGLSRGGAVGFHIPAALVAAPGPVRIRFIHPDIHRPMDLYGGSDDRELSFSVRSLQLVRVLPRPLPEHCPALPPDQMIMRFESLGDNCEFGLAQRLLGAEPLGLLRFSFMELPLLRLGLRRAFDGLGDPGTVEVIVAGNDREFVVKESVYGMTYHTFQYEHQMSFAEVLVQQTSRLHFLKRKLMEDIAAEEKIFVIKRDPPLRPEEVLPIYTILNESARNWLLWMVPSDTAHAPGTVETLLPGLLRGYVDRFAPSENAHDLSIEGWQVCLLLRMARRRLDTGQMMLWGWWRDSRDRRLALRDLNESQRAEEAVLMDQNLNPLNLAKLCLDSDLTAAASQWERARQLVPNAVVELEDFLNILLRLKRYDEAEALMRERQKRLRADRFCLTGLATIAEQRGQIDEALTRWKIVRSRVRDNVEGYHGCARCLVNLGLFDQAETQLNHALRRDPRDHGTKVGLARISDRRKDWAQSIVRWKHLAETYQDAPAFAFVAKALIQLDRADEAEAWLEEPSRLFTKDLEIAVTRAELAKRRGDLTAACDRWAMVRAIDPYFRAGYDEGSLRLFEAGLHSEADTVLRAAIERFPDQVWPLRYFARMAHDRRDWNDAASRWKEFHQRFPAEDAGFSLSPEASAQSM